MPERGRDARRTDRVTPDGAARGKAVAFLLFGVMLEGVIVIPFLIAGPPQACLLLYHMIAGEEIWPGGVGGWLLAGWILAQAVAGAVLVVINYRILRRDGKALRDDPH